MTYSNTRTFYNTTNFTNNTIRIFYNTTNNPNINLLLIQYLLLKLKKKVKTGPITLGVAFNAVSFVQFGVGAFGIGGLGVGGSGVAFNPVPII